MNLLLMALSLLCTYGMVGCAYAGFLYTESPMALVLYGTLPMTAAVLVLCVCLCHPGGPPDGSSRKKATHCFSAPVCAGYH